MTTEKYIGSCNPRLCHVICDEVEMLEYKSSDWVYDTQIGIFKAPGFGYRSLAKILDMKFQKLYLLSEVNIFPRHKFLVYDYYNKWCWGWHIEEVKVLSLLVRKLYGRAKLMKRHFPEVLQMHKNVEIVRENILQRYIDDKDTTNRPANPIGDSYGPE